MRSLIIPFLISLGMLLARTGLRARRFWAVRIEGEPNPVFMYRTQGPAISHGMARARKRRCELVVQSRVARPREASSYATDPFAPRG